MDLERKYVAIWMICAEFGTMLALRPRGTVTKMAPLASKLHALTFCSASAFSSQNRMFMSWYIVVAVVRCSCACSRLSARR